MVDNSIPQEAREEWLLANYLVTKITDKASGAFDAECHFNFPRDVYFLGNLRPKNDNEISLNKRDLMQKLSPSAFGAEFKIDIKTLPTTILVTLKWDCYYRLFPTYEQQKNWMNQPIEVDFEEEPESTVLTDDSDDDDIRQPAIKAPSPIRRSAGMSREDVFIRFRKISCYVDGDIIIDKVGDMLQVDQSDLELKIQRELQRISSLIAADPDRMRINVAGHRFTIPQAALDSRNAYTTFINSLQIPVNNAWDWEISRQIKREGNENNSVVFLIQFVNSSPNNESDKTIEPFLFNPSATFKFPGSNVLPFDLELAPHGFRYDSKLWGKGFNCGLVVDDSKMIYTTTHTPNYTQNRYVSRMLPKAKFIDLADAPVPVLNSIYIAMEESLKDWESAELVYQENFGNIWEKTHKEQYDNDRKKFIEEIRRFKKGLELIESNEDICFAFKLMNEVFKRAGYSKDGVIKKESWRLFQIVFIISQIPGMAALMDGYKHFEDERKFVDIIYFPTGGGKTEAYLGTLIFHCFFDRLRGKTAGVTSWIRFPLRLLTIQQTQRLADVVGLAELLRGEQTDIRLNTRVIHKFSIGYYVGSEGTPNEIKKPFNGLPEAIWDTAKDAAERQNWKRVVTCPSCKTNTIQVDFDETKVKIIHRCVNSGCRFKDGVLPVFVIDNELYRNLPTVIVGTIDKLATLGLQRKVSMLFGRVDGYCKDHGFYNSTCCQKECTDTSKLVPSIPPGLSGPTLFIQDELHLLREGIGTFDSHYETFAQELLKQFEANSSLKIIASSATIEKYERQVEHLYGRNTNRARVFPGLGVTNQRSFYAETKSYPQRIFIGILPHNKTLFRAILELLEYYHRFLQDLARTPSGDVNPYGGIAIPGSKEWIELMDLYYSSLSYFSSTRDLDSLKTDFETYINNEKFRNEKYTPVCLKQLTGGTSTDEVSRILEDLERPHSLSDQHDAVLATNMVSHGVDIDRLNCMFFYGIPKQNAEYIQASSRVGRTHVGLVFDCFHPIRERDQSHYSYFIKYHEFLGRLIEPVAINRWSAYGIDKTLPGIFLGVLLQILSNKDNGPKRNWYYMTSKISKLFTDGVITKEQIKQILKDSYNAELLADTRNDIFNKKINKMVDIFFDNIISANNNNDSNFVQNALFPSPLKSLRDIDEPISIELDPLGSDWGNKK